MSNRIEITDFTAPELDVYARIPEVQLLRFYEPKPGLFIAESPKVIQRAANAGYQPVSFLVQHKDLEKEGKELLQKFPGIPVYTADYEVLVKLTGFALTRGMLCAMTRRDLPSVEDICKNARRIAILENVVNPTNIGAIFQLPRFIWMRFFSPQAVVILFTAEPPGKYGYCFFRFHDLFS